VPALRVCALYPDLMNIYADRGNLLMLERRCAWRGIGFELAAAGFGDPIDPDAHDLFYMGGGQDRDQELCAADLVATKRDALAAAADAGRVILGVCGGYQLLGHAYALDDRDIPGLGLVDLRTVRDAGPRLIGNVAIEVELDGAPRVLAGVENHAGRTDLGPGAHPLGRVLLAHAAPADEDVARRDVDHAVDHPHGGRLATARRTDEHADLARRDLERQVADHRRSVRVALGDVAELEGGWVGQGGDPVGEGDVPGLLVR
jgi:CobQ-like glutamine amidotransferase family enzyme